jgi:hypothetical protein
LTTWAASTYIAAHDVAFHIPRSPPPYRRGTGARVLKDDVTVPQELAPRQPRFPSRAGLSNGSLEPAAVFMSKRVLWFRNSVHSRGVYQGNFRTETTLES